MVDLVSAVRAAPIQHHICRTWWRISLHSEWHLWRVGFTVYRTMGISITNACSTNRCCYRARIFRAVACKEVWQAIETFAARPTMASQRYSKPGDGIETSSVLLVRSDLLQ